MSILSGLFSSSDDHSSSSDNLLGALDSALSVDASHSNYDQTTDSDGSSHTSADSNSFGLNSDTSALVHNIFHDMSDSSHSGGTFG